MSRSGRYGVIATLLLAASLLTSGPTNSPATQIPLAGPCLEGYANVTANGTTVGPTSPICVRSTSCGFSVGSGPKANNVGDVWVRHYVNVPDPGSPEGPTCYL